MPRSHCCFFKTQICLDSVYLWDYSKPHPWILTKDENIGANIDDGEQEKDFMQDDDA